MEILDKPQYGPIFFSFHCGSQGEKQIIKHGEECSVDLHLRSDDFVGKHSI